MSTAREMLSDILLSSGAANVDVPVSFDDISVCGASSADGYLESLEHEFSDRAKVIPQYRDLKEKLGGALFGFYINHSVEQQNEINARFLDVLREFKANNDEIVRLSNRLKELESRMDDNGGIR